MGDVDSENVTHLNRRTTELLERQPGYAWIIKPQKHYGLVWDPSNVDHYEKEIIAMTEFRYFCPVDSVAVLN